MPLIKFVVETGINCRIAGINISKEKYPIYEEFDTSKPIIAEGRVFIEDGMLKCEAEIPYDFMYTFPAIQVGLRDGEKDIDPSGRLNQCALMNIGVTFGPLKDRTIKNIFEQQLNGK